MYRFQFAVAILGLSASVARAQWQAQTSGTEADFRGVSAVSAKVTWVSGTKGTFVRTTDGGKNWLVGTVAGAEKLDFRDIEAFGEATAYVLSAGPGGESRIYKTTDAGKSWKLQFQNADPAGFFDALAFWDDKAGIALKGGDAARTYRIVWALAKHPDAVDRLKKAVADQNRRRSMSRH